MNRLPRILGLFVLTVSAPARGQARPDSSTTDSTRRTSLPELTVRVTRSDEARSRLPFAVGVIDGSAVRRAQLTVGLDESLSRIPGVVVFNRYNYSVDQRVSLRGAGSRANFGLRGVKVLIDGVPQTLPDGQSQLTNLELGVVDRVEVLTGGAAALYGNASGGVLSFTTKAPTVPFTASIRAVGGSFGTSKYQGTVSGERGRASGLLSYSRFKTDGFRQHGGAETRELFAKGDVTLSPRMSLGVRFSAANAPKAENPGALTVAEYAARRDSAAGNNILRGADKDVSQQQLALRWQWNDRAGANMEATAFGVLRNLKNPLATSPPTPPGVTSTTGTYNTIDREAGGVRIAGTLPVSLVGTTVHVSSGVDLQSMRDDRKNQRSLSGAPTGIFFADQRETVTEVGPFLRVHWEPASRATILGSVRYDWLQFRVRDHYLADGVDNSGTRRMRSASGSLGASYLLAGDFTVYSNLATSFETPTTTELVNTQNGTVGFNTSLGPQRTVTGEVGVRGNAGTRVSWTAAGWYGTIRDAIIQAREVDGRAFFQNAGRVRTRGAELGLDLAPAPWIHLATGYTYSVLTFSDYKIPNGATTDVLDGKRLAGVPRHFFRGTLSVNRGPITAEWDQVTAGSVFADDKNTQKVEGWGAGVSSVRLSGSWRWGALRIEPFGALNNAFDRRYVGSVNLNGASGRVLEPAGGRNGVVGVGVGWKG